MIQKTLLFGIFFLTVTSFALSEDEEILRDLEFFKSFQVVKAMNDLAESAPQNDQPSLPVTKKTEVKNEPH